MGPETVGTVLPPLSVPWTNVIKVGPNSYYIKSVLSILFLNLRYLTMADLDLVGTVGKTPTYAKHWCFTLNNWTSRDKLRLTTDLYTYLVYGEEEGLIERTPHLQGYIVFKDKKRLTACKKILPGAHWEPMKGTPQQASDYCKKDGNFFEDGTLPVTSVQTAKKAGAIRLARLEEGFELAKEGRLYEIRRDVLIPHLRAFKTIQSDHQQPLPSIDGVCGKWFYGPPGTGKSYTARLGTDNKHYDKLPNKWWDGYSNQETVIIDDLDTSHSYLYSFLKRWTDKYSFPVEMKGSLVQIRPKTIIVTSNYTIRELFSTDPKVKEVDIQALERRFTSTHFGVVRSSLTPPPSPQVLHRQNAQLFTATDFEWEPTPEPVPEPAKTPERVYISIFDSDEE